MPKFIGTSYKLDQPIYDTVQLAAAAGPLTYSFFTVPQGGVMAGAVVKDYAHTNMIQAGTLERGTTFLLRGLSLSISETAVGGARPTLADNIIVYGGDVTLRLGQREFGHWQTRYLNSAGQELQYFSNIAAAATEFHVNRGVSHVENYRKLNYPLQIEEQEQIQVLLRIPGTIGAVTDVTITLHGDMTRPVQ